MKTKVSLIALVVIVAIIAVGAKYIVALNARTRALETRLARVETELNGANRAQTQNGTRPMALAQKGNTLMFTAPQVQNTVVSRDSLESRVEKIEKELTPHLEELPNAPAESPGVLR